MKTGELLGLKVIYIQEVFSPRPVKPSGEETSSTRTDIRFFSFFFFFFSWRCFLERKYILHIVNNVQ